MHANSLPRAPESTLLTDLYELTMLQAYGSAGMNETAVFELFVRALPPGRNFLLAAGLAQAVETLSDLGFSPDELAWLESTGRFQRSFLKQLADLRFTGDLDAPAEGTVCFADEPLLRVTAPLAQAQLAETRLMNLVHYQTLVASKAVRCVLAAAGRPLVDFGLRRAHGAEAGLLSARASYLAGFAGTATSLAAALFDIPVFGTMAHSYVQAHDDELQAFRNFAHAFPGASTLLIDTYDTEAAARKVVDLARELERDGIRIPAVRLDSGDLAVHAHAVRRILDAGGCAQTTIFASGNLDEHRIADLVESGAPIDAFGVGTRMNVSADHPFLDCAYKLVEYAGRGRRKRSEGKASWPGRKQVFRSYDADGKMAADIVTVDGDAVDGAPLIAPVMRAGRPVAARPSLADLRMRAREEIDRLPEALRGLQPAPPYPVTIAPALQALAREVDRTLPGGP